MHREAKERTTLPRQACDHSDGVLICRERDGKSRAQCLRCGEVGSPCEDFEAALRDLQERAG